MITMFIINRSFKNYSLKVLKFFYGIYCENPYFVECTCCYTVNLNVYLNQSLGYSLHRPVDFPPWCEVRVESLTCQVTLVMTYDPRLPCIPGEENNVDPRHGALNMKLEG